ncbi:MAG: TerD family protein [Alphaproteobacteria bacterium]|nr:TerD family protein [Alphaproteobacteria bacterium]
MVDIFDTQFDENKFEISDNRIAKGEDVNLSAKHPTLRNLTIAVGWDANAFDSDPPDVDLSCFLLNRNDKTRINEDFVFYNNPESKEKGVIYGGDNRTGAGEGDDESISLDLQAIPFDILRLMFVISIYQGEEREQTLSKIRNCYLRLLLTDNGEEILRYELDPDIEECKETGMLVASLNREGPKWHLVALGESVPGGLPTIATNYDIIVQSS